ncbi:MAG: bifunctional phosphoribosyl-AMP cyclohydrolase/phosphoribosyl-ATP diphosphatase HisIE [Bacteroidota bacterium]
MLDKLNFEKMNGVIPAIVQHAETGTVLMTGFMNRDALDRTTAERQVVFWSRTKGRLWKKGETSGNFLDVVAIHEDCDSDAVLILAKPRGPVCHTGAQSCFGDEGTGSGIEILWKLISIIRDRKTKLPSESYTAKLFSKGVAKIGQKVGEEGVELAIAAQYDDKQRCIEEAADLLYHTLVLLEAKDITITSVFEELGKRMTK